MKPGELETADFTGIVAGGAPFDPVADGLAGRLVRLSHGLLALYLGAPQVARWLPACWACPTSRRAWPG